MVQVAIVIVDRVRYSVSVSSGQFVAIVAILFLQGYLVLSSSTADSAVAPTVTSIAGASAAPEGSTP
jgi:hypothetical protein